MIVRTAFKLALNFAAFNVCQGRAARHISFSALLLPYCFALGLLWLTLKENGRIEQLHPTVRKFERWKRPEISNLNNLYVHLGVPSDAKSSKIAFEPPWSQTHVSYIPKSGEAELVPGQMFIGS
ncbi:unnamed protein product [Cladocopium goreaui]|uniref:Uncharacterized protein n=1 Tax=Cladocopium goreaui TaxID=2562237 RepID=A0A9P1FYA4_9DINO|nr:unnamed protein product [Cladocopium goreaui]